MLKQRVEQQLATRGKTPGARLLILRNLLDDGQDVCIFMGLSTPEDIAIFYDTHQEEIDELCAEDDDLLEDEGVHTGVKHALEKILMLVEDEMKNVRN